MTSKDKNKCHPIEHLILPIGIIRKKRGKTNTAILKVSKDETPRKKGIDLNHVFYVVVGEQCRTENACTG